MSMICPLCNGLRNLQLHICSACGHEMEDQGRVREFFGPYSPYEEPKIANSFDEKCVHLIGCPGCSKDFRVDICLIEI